MRTVFADTLYWVAIYDLNDQWAPAARRAMSSLGHVRLLTTDEVLSEFLTVMCGERVRIEAAQLVRSILDHSNIKVLPQTRDSFLQGLERYEQRGDKEYSLADCISMNAMDSERVTDVLTGDGHFTQEGFNILMTEK